MTPSLCHVSRSGATGSCGVAGLHEVLREVGVEVRNGDGKTEARAGAEAEMGQGLNDVQSRDEQ